MTITIRTVRISPEDTLDLGPDETLVDQKFIFDHQAMVQDHTVTGKWLLLIAKSSPGTAV